MLTEVFNHSQLQSAKQHAKTAVARLADRHINLAVTGLSRSGKTAFICSFVNQLLEANSSATLPFFSVLQQGRLVGVKRVSQPDQTLGRFAYDEAMQRLNARPAHWPISTNGVSQIRLQIKFRTAHGLRKLISEQSVLTVDITDYPGEWLLDLPLLDMDYKGWCEHFSQQFHRPQHFESGKAFFEAAAQMDVCAGANEQRLKAISELFTQYLLDSKEAGYPLIQPGRFVLPGDLKDAPVLHFFPIPMHMFTKTDKREDKANGEESNIGVLQKRFELYKNQIIKPFYKQHFRRFDRQIVLVDCLSALNAGHTSFQDLQLAIQWILKSFDYGQSNVLKRLIAPKIDKLVFAASKADQVTPEQHPALVKLLESMVHDARLNIQYEGVHTESTALAAIGASTAGIAEYGGKTLNILQGDNLRGEPVTLFPGDVPQTCPSSDFWDTQGFDFTDFAPPKRDPLKALPHIRMDQVLEFVLADKLV